MSMPEATIDEDTGAVFSHHDIRMSGQSVVIEPVSEPLCEEIFPHNEFGFGVLGMNGRHIVVAPLLFKRSHAGKGYILISNTQPMIERSVDGFALQDSGVRRHAVG